MEKITCVNKSILTWARKQAGYSHIEISNIIKKDVSKWENGEDYPTYSQLKKLSDKYKKPVAIFFFPEPPKLISIRSSCRTLPSNIADSLSPVIIRLLNKARVMQLNLYELHEDKNPSSIKITEFDFSDFDYENVANNIRNILNISIDMQKKIKQYNESFEFWREQFYQIGIYVFKDAFKDSNISGFCVYDTEFPVIYINNQFSFSRQIFTLFHELYHIVTQTSGIDFINDDFLTNYSNSTSLEIERRCNKFASEFLVPTNDFYSLVKSKNISDELIGKYAKLYTVSREVILTKLLTLGLIQNDYYKEKKELYTEDYYRAQKINKSRSSQFNYYNTQIAYKGQRFLENAYMSYYRNKINISQLSSFLNMKIPSVRSLADHKGWGRVR